MQQVYRDVLILCPEVATGGPEALHQLGHRIACHGGTAHMVYYGPVSRIDIEGDVLRCHADASPMPEQFARYRPKPLREARLGPDTLVVFPEPLSSLAAVSDAPYQRALWWLSLDNGVSPNPQLLDEGYRLGFFADAGLMHFYQSDYARSFLQGNGARQYYALSDYTDQDFVHRSLVPADTVAPSGRGNKICFFPNKGASLAAQFIEKQDLLQQPVEFVPIRGMTKVQVRNTLFDARLYIDFGHHPGKDRVPREAATAGAVVLLHSWGAARHFTDHSLPAEYLFAEEDVASGALHRKVDAILADVDAHFARQRFYRDSIKLERERFDLEVRSLFFTAA